MDHTIDDVELESTDVAVTFKEVCVNNEVESITQCATALGPFLSEILIKGRMLIARVTRVHAFAQGNCHICDIALESYIRISNDSTIDLRPLHIVGACNKRGFTDKTFGSKKNVSTVESDSCVLKETGSAHVFAVLLNKLTSVKLGPFDKYVTILKRPGDFGP